MFQFKGIMPVFNYKGLPIAQEEIDDVENIERYKFNINSSSTLDEWERVAILISDNMLINNLFLYKSKYLFAFSIWGDGFIPKDAFQEYWIDLDYPYWELNNIQKSDFKLGFIDNDILSGRNFFGRKKLKAIDILPTCSDFVDNNLSPDFYLT